MTDLDYAIECNERLASLRIRAQDLGCTRLVFDRVECEARARAETTLQGNMSAMMALMERFVWMWANGCAPVTLAEVK